MTSPSENLQLVIERTFDAPRERVFRAWIDPVLMSKWFAPVGMRPVEVEVDAQVGGKYRFGMQEPDGRTFRVSGEYLEIKAPDRLVFTWSWLSNEQLENTVVTVEFYDRGAATHVILTHERLRTSAIREGNRAGWNGCFDNLQQRLSSGEV